MQNKIEKLIDLIYEKLKKNNSRKLSLKKDELRKFINYLINNS